MSIDDYVPDEDGFSDHDRAEIRFEMEAVEREDRKREREARSELLNPAYVGTPEILRRCRESVPICDYVMRDEDDWETFELDDERYAEAIRTRSAYVVAIVRSLAAARAAILATFANLVEHLVVEPELDAEQAIDHDLPPPPRALAVVASPVHLHAPPLDAPRICGASRSAPRVPRGALAA